MHRPFKNAVSLSFRKDMTAMMAEYAERAGIEHQPDAIRELVAMALLGPGKDTTHFIARQHVVAGIRKYVLARFLAAIEDIDNELKIAIESGSFDHLAQLNIEDYPEAESAPVESGS